MQLDTRPKPHPLNYVNWGNKKMPRERGSKSMLDLSLAMQYKARQGKGKDGIACGDMMTLGLHLEFEIKLDNFCS